MIRISGIVLPDNKRIDIGLTTIYGVGRSNAKDILNKSQIDLAKKVKDLTSDEVSRLQTLVETTYKVEGNLRKKLLDSIKRLKDINCYRGIRHAKNLPARGQRTRSNARTKRGKRVTIGAMRKDTRAKMTTGQKETATK